MKRLAEPLLAICLYGLLALAIINSGWAGLIAAVAWVGCGIHLTMQTRSRGFIADACFIVTWPIYVALGR